MPRTQENRPFRIKTQLGDDALELESFEGSEGISTPYSYVLHVLSETPVDTKSQLKKPVVLTMKLADGGERHIHGNIKRMALREQGSDGSYAYVIEMAPWTWFLNLFKDSAVFQNLNVPDIVKKVFEKRGMHDYRFSLQGSYPVLDHCLQYRETDFNFVSRLLEQEGIYYYFEQSVSKVTMVLADNNSALVACPKAASVRYMASSAEAEIEDTIRSLSHEVQCHTGKSTTWDYNFETPATDLTAGETSQNCEIDGEFYDYSHHYMTKSEGNRYARIRIEEHEARLETVRGEANSSGLECGYKFKLEEHASDSLNQEYLLTGLSYRGRNGAYRSGNQQETNYEFSSGFEAIPFSVTYRPPRVAERPFVRGVQTAVVVGKSGEEIWTDEFGRVRVQFFWDRTGGTDEKATAWVRVAQAWAGKNWGFFTIPRIGQEVIVAFIEGDPDQPIIVGSVHNAIEMPPYALPDHQTRSTLKTLSTKGGGGFNELRFEDKKGSEQVFMHAEKNLDIQVKADRMESIGNNRSLTVANDKYEKIGADEHNHTVGKRVEKIEGSHLVEILTDEGIKITGNRSVEVTGNVVETYKGNHNLDVTQNIYIKGMQVVIEADIGLTLKMGPNFITIDPSGIAISGVPFVQINSGGSALSGSPGQSVTGEAPKDPVAADNDQPGSVDATPSPHPAPPATVNLLNVSPTVAAQEQDEPDRQAPPPSQGGTSSQAEYATFPPGHDGEAQAQALRQAAEDGTPFCEECERARRQQQQGGGGGSGAGGGSGGSQ